MVQGVNGGHAVRPPGADHVLEGLSVPNPGGRPGSGRHGGRRATQAGELPRSPTTCAASQLALPGILARCERFRRLPSVHSARNCDIVREDALKEC
jgi:hypothetical protein